MSTDNSSSIPGSASRSGSAADSYVGSLISLTSKSEIRYEGVLYNINTDESSIGLRNVRSFGTEGRKKDSPQVPPSDKVYDYILFRGSDIKDLQVKSSPPVLPTPSINNDPAIIQSHYPRPSSTSFSSAASGPLPDGSSSGPHNQQAGLPGANFQSGLPLYQPGGNLGTWAASPSPANVNGGGVTMPPMYWPVGYYGPPPNGLQHYQQQSMLRPPLSLSMAPTMQQPMQYPSYNASLPAGGQNFQVPNLPASNLQEVSPPLISTNMNSLDLMTTSLPSSTLPTASPLVPPATLASETLPSLIPNKTPNSALSVGTLSLNLPSLSNTYGQEFSSVMPPISNKVNSVASSTTPFQVPSKPMSSMAMIPNSIPAEISAGPAPVMITPSHLLQSESTPVSTVSQPVQTSHRDVEVVQVSPSLPSQTSMPALTESQRPVQPLLPPPQTTSQKPHATVPIQNRHGYRGRERGRGSGMSRPATKFTEDFDFTRMNEKFNKDEVWGHLGKSNGTVSDGDLLAGEDAEASKTVMESVYNKDDFFDSLSSNNTVDRNTQNGRMKFSEQMKMDTETFGDFPYRGGRGGRGPPYGGGRSRGSYYGRGYGYGYGGRGRGRSNMQGRAS